MPLSSWISSYIGQLRQHMADDRSLVDAFRAHPGARSVRFASDYSEIYAYTYVLEPDDVGYSPKPDRHRQIALNEVWATRLFFNPASLPVLLDPYRIELSTLVSNTALDQAGTYADLAYRLQNEEGTPAEWLEWLRAIDVGLGSSSPRTTLNLLTGIYQRAPGLLLLMSEELKPAPRLRHLLTTANFEPLVKPGETLTPSLETQHWWTSRLQQERPDRPKSTNAIDARAMALLQAANRSPSATHSTVLVSRSVSMRRILADRPPENMEAELEAYRAATRGVYIVPSRVLGSYLVAERSRASVREVIENRYWLSRETLGLYRDLEGRDQESYDLRTMIDRVRALWEEVDDASIVQSIWSGEGNTDGLARAGKDTLETVRAFIRGQGSLRRLLADRASDVGDQLSLNNAMIAAVGVLGADNAAQPVDVDVHRKPSADADRPSLTIKASSRLMQYSLQLFDADFGRFWREADNNALAALSRFVKAEMPDTGYERLLGTGYSLAAVGSWEIAYQFFTLAVTYEQKTVPRHEALYFRALARRNASDSVTAMAVKLSLKDLEAALTEKRRIRGTDYVDPRYYCEIGIMLGFAHRMELNDVPAFLGTPDPEVVWRSALAVVVDDDTLRVQLLNNIVYHLYSQMRPRPGKALRRAFKELLDAAAKVGPERITYNIEHTIVVVGLALGKRTAEELSVAREKLLALQIVEGGSKYLKNALVTDLAGIDTALAEFG